MRPSISPDSKYKSNVLKGKGQQAVKAGFNRNAYRDKTEKIFEQKFAYEKFQFRKHQHQHQHQSKGGMGGASQLAGVANPVMDKTAVNSALAIGKFITALLKEPISAIVTLAKNIVEKTIEISMKTK